MKRLSSSAAGLLGLAMMLNTPVNAQLATANPAGAIITPEAIYQHLTVIADDSMMGRDTPSPGLDMTAQYVADQFASLGLEPGGENGTWFQRYPIYRTQLDTEHSHVGFMIGDAHLNASFATDAARWFGSIPSNEVRGTAVVMGGILHRSICPPRLCPAFSAPRSSSLSLRKESTSSINSVGW